MKFASKAAIFGTLAILVGCGGSSSSTEQSASQTPPLQTTGTRPLNDTGIVLCGDYAHLPHAGAGYHNNNLDCSDQNPGATQTTDGTEHASFGGSPIPAGQDALYGRDANPTLNSDSDGHKGFSFTRLDNNGDAVNFDCSSYISDPAKGLTQADAQACYTANPWSCVKDNVTGLIWKVKTTSGLQSSSYEYTWYNSTGSNHGGEPGIGDLGIGVTTGYSTANTLYAGSDNCEDASRCDIEKYPADVNAAGICGATDWRMPTSEELLSIINAGREKPAIDTSYFPNTQTLDYWTSSPTAD